MTDTHAHAHRHTHAHIHEHTHTHEHTHFQVALADKWVSEKRVTLSVQFTLFREYSPAFEPRYWDNEFGGPARERPVLPDSAKRDVSDVPDITIAVVEKGRHRPGLEAYLRDHPVAGVVARALAALAGQDDEETRRDPATFLALFLQDLADQPGQGVAAAVFFNAYTANF